VQGESRPGGSRNGATQSPASQERRTSALYEGFDRHPILDIILATHRRQEATQCLFGFEERLDVECNKRVADALQGRTQALGAFDDGIGLSVGEGGHMVVSSKNGARVAHTGPAENPAEAGV